jgi:hypothetical protein
VRTEVVLNRIVVQERVVHVEKKHYPRDVPHGAQPHAIPYTPPAEAVYAVSHALEGGAP